MGDLANMTSVHGEVDGFRLLRWLRSKAEMEQEAALHWHREDDDVAADMCVARRNLLTGMADDLAAELTPPDYSDMTRDEAVQANIIEGENWRDFPGDDSDTVDLDARNTGPCEGCGRLADRVPVQDNGRAWLACPDCAARVSDDTVDMDDPAFLGRPEQE